MDIDSWLTTDELFSLLRCLSFSSLRGPYMNMKGGALDMVSIHCRTFVYTLLICRRFLLLLVHVHTASHWLGAKPGDENGSSRNLRLLEKGSIIMTTT